MNGVEKTLFFFGFHLARLDDQRVGYKLPEIFYLEAHHVVLFAQPLHDLVTAVVAWGNKQLGTGVLDLFGLYPAVEDALLDIGSSPCAAARAAAEVVGPIGIHIDEVLTALLCDPPGFLVIAMAEGAFALAAVIARVMIGSEMGVHRFIQRDASLLDILLEKIVYRKKLDFAGKPFLQTKPGRIVCVASLG